MLSGNQGVDLLLSGIIAQSDDAEQWKHPNQTALRDSACGGGDKQQLFFVVALFNLGKVFSMYFLLDS